MKILIVSQFFYPETGAASNRVYELGRMFAGKGHSLSVLTTFPNYPKGKLFDGYEKSSFHHEEIEGIKVYRVPSFISKYTSALSRARSYLSFTLNAIRNFKRIEKADIVIGTSGPVFVMFTAYFISKRLGIPCVLEVRDIQSKALRATGLIGKAIPINIISSIEKYFLGRADMIVVVTKKYKLEIMEALKKEEQRVEVIANGMDFSRKPIKPSNGGLTDLYKRIKKKKSEGLQVISYFGNMGVTQRVGELFQKFTKQKNDEFIFLIFGNGAEEGIISSLSDENSNLLYHESIPEEELMLFYGLSDFNIVKILDHPELSSMVPLKLYTIMGHGNVPVFIGPEGEAAEIIGKVESGLCFRDDEIDSILPFCASMDKDKKYMLKSKFLEFTRTNFNREDQAERYLEVLLKCLPDVR